MRTYRHIETGSIVCITDDREMSDEYELFDIAQMLTESTESDSSETGATKSKTARKRVARKKAE